MLQNRMLAAGWLAAETSDEPRHVSKQVVRHFAEGSTR